MEQSFFYQESGNINPPRLIASYILCIAAAFIFGYLYSILTVIMPIVYLNVLLTIGFAYLLILTIKFSVRIGHIRNRRARIIQAIITGLLACYFQWAAYILFAILGEVPAPEVYISNFHLLLNPVTFFSTIAEMAKVGMWSIFGGVLKGAGLAIIWAIEAIIIIFTPVLVIFKSPPAPYSELLGRWYEKYILYDDFENFFSTEEIISGLQTAPLSTLQNLGKGTEHQHVKVHLFYLKDEGTDYLSFERVTHSGSQKNKRESDFFIHNLALKKSDADSIMHDYSHKLKKFDLL